MKEKAIEFITPIIYAVAWIVILWLAYKLLPREIVADGRFQILFTIVFLFALISKSTSWTIGHDKFGIKGDSRSQIISYDSEENGKFSFDLFADNPDLLKNQKVQELIRELTKSKTTAKTGK